MNPPTTVHVPRQWSCELSTEQVTLWVRSMLDARILPSMAQIAVDLILKQLGSTRVRITLEAVP